MHVHAGLKSVENQKRPSLKKLERTSGVHTKTDPPVFVWHYHLLGTKINIILIIYEIWNIVDLLLYDYHGWIKFPLLEI
jgi:hypothetical protein